MADFDVEGAEALANLAKVLKSAGNGKELRKELLRGFRAAGKPITNNIKANLRGKLPQRGGLAADMGKSRVAVRNRLTGDKAGIRIDVKHTQHDVTAINRGRLRHPVFGHRRWVNQSVEPNLVSDPVDEGKPRMQIAVAEAVDNVFNRIERSV